MANPSIPGPPNPGFPPPSSAHRLEPGRDLLPVPIGAPPSEPHHVPPMAEPLGIPGGMSPEIVSDRAEDIGTLLRPSTFQPTIPFIPLECRSSRGNAPAAARR